MADQIWSKNTFCDGYSTGSITDLYDENEDAKALLLSQEQKFGGNFCDFLTGVVKLLLKPQDRVLELGSGRGTFTR